MHDAWQKMVADAENTVLPKPGRLRWACGGQKPERGVAETRRQEDLAIIEIRCILPAIYPHVHNINLLLFRDRGKGTFVPFGMKRFIKLDRCPPKMPAVILSTSVKAS